MLDVKTFSEVIKNTPLTSIDLIVKNDNNQVLLGKRVNEPAKDQWFVPGGRIFKEEPLEEAFERTVKNELNLNMKKAEATFYGLYEHFYDNNVFNNEFTTHYIVLAHEMKLSRIPELNDQHTNYKWFKIAELLASNEVHNYTKDYFR